MRIQPIQNNLYKQEYNKKEHKHYLYNVHFGNLTINSVKKKAVQQTGPVIGTLISICTFISQYRLNRNKVLKDIECGKIELTGKKIDTQNPANINYVKEYNHPTTQYDIHKIKRSHFAKLLGINQHSVDWHVKKGHIILNKDLTIDITHPINKNFMENFSKLKRKKNINYPTDKYEILQKELGRLPLSYCLEHGLLIADENGEINNLNEINKNFLEKIKNKEITVNTYFISIPEFAKRAKLSISTVTRAKMHGKIIYTENFGFDINNPINIKYIEDNKTKKEKEEIQKNNHSLLTIKQLKNFMGYANSNSIYYNLKNGKLVTNEYGYIDITIEPNKTTISKGKKNVNSTPKNKKTTINKNKNNDKRYITQTELAKLLNVAQPTILWHNEKQHLNYTPNKGYDLEDPHNIYFIENFIKGKEYIPLNTTKKTEIKENNTTEIKEKDFNLLKISELSTMLGIAQSALHKYANEGKIITDEKKYLDLTNPINKKFIETYQEKYSTRIVNYNPIRFAKAVKGLKNILYARTSAEVFIVGKSLMDTNRQTYEDYMKYSLEKIIDLSALNEKQEEAIFKLFLEMIDEKFNSKKLHTHFYSETNKLDITNFIEIINGLVKYENIKIDNKSFTEYRKSIENKPISDIEENNKNNISKTHKDFEKCISTIKNLYIQKIKTLNKLSNIQIDKLIDMYLYNEFNQALFHNTLIYTKNNLNHYYRYDNLKPEQIDIIVEKILLKEIPEDKLKNKNYLEWKSEININRVKTIVNKIISSYKEHLLNNIYLNTAFQMYQNINPNMNVTEKDFINYLNTRLELKI